MDDLIISIKGVAHSIGDYVHVGLGGIFALFLYRENVSRLQPWERVLYCLISVALGIYGGEAIIEFFDINPASNVARFVSIIIAIFGLAILALARDNLDDIAGRLKDKWLSK